MAAPDGHLLIGTAYYPEQWPQERWQTDAELMARAGIKRVRLGEFAWHKLEPREGHYELDWLERAIEVLGAQGLDIILCTPTPTYPAWLHRKYPDIHQVKSNGQIKEFGQRQDACKNHPGYRTHARAVSEAVAKRFGNHPKVVAWQTDNELGCHGTATCYCAHCEREFQQWLSRRFEGKIELLNEAWGTAFWSQGYNDFSEISLPRDTADRSGMEGQNPGLSLDFFRFSSDVQVSFHRELAGIIRASSPSRPITHNLMGAFTDIDYFRLADSLDVVSWDNYPFFQLQAAHRPPAPLPHDLMRGLKRKNVWVMEQAAGPGGWDRFLPTPEPGRMRLWAFQAVAHGADFISFFRWRSARFGTEQYWHGILPHHGTPGARYAELSRFASEIAALDRELAGTTVHAEVAIVFDYASLWGLRIQPHSPAGVSYYEVAGAYASAFMRLGVSVDVVAPGSDLSGYAMVVVPPHYVTSTQFAASLRGYVDGGGVAIVGVRSGVKNEENAIWEEELPGAFREMVGCTVDDYDVFSHLVSEPLEVATAGGKRIQARHLAEILSPGGEATPFLTYRGRYYTGAAAAVRNAFGRGVAYYLGTLLDADGLVELLPEILAEASIPVMAGLDPSVEIGNRRRKDVVFRFYMNHDSSPKSVRLVRGGTELLSNAPVSTTIELPPLGVAVVKEAPSSSAVQ
ncbi:MAG TPA: beta-galactosidase [Spirochaetia bacterium]|nr:beta-galactosidase [Spirochaetia bacterium]